MRAPAVHGWDVEGGYADYCLVDEAFAYALPDGLDDEKIAPLLCAGIIGYRSLRDADVPPGGSLGIYGFGAARTSPRSSRCARGCGCTC